MARKPYPSDVKDDEWAFIAPWADKMECELGISKADAGFNPTAQLIGSGVDIKDIAEELAGLMLPGQHRMNESASYFLDFGRSMAIYSA